MSSTCGRGNGRTEEPRQGPEVPPRPIRGRFAAYRELDAVEMGARATSPRIRSANFHQVDSDRVDALFLCHAVGWSHADQGMSLCRVLDACGGAGSRMRFIAAAGGWGSGRVRAGDRRRSGLRARRRVVRRRLHDLHLPQGRPVALRHGQLPGQGAAPGRGLPRLACRDGLQLSRRGLPVRGCPGWIPVVLQLASADGVSERPSLIGSRD